MNREWFFIKDKLCCLSLSRHIPFKLDDDIPLCPDAMFHAQRYSTVGALYVFRCDMYPAQVVTRVVFGYTPEQRGLTLTE
jgi:hypothetical protein